LWYILILLIVNIQSFINMYKVLSYSIEWGTHCDL
jgi:hypothetical protein